MPNTGTRFNPFRICRIQSGLSRLTVENEIAEHVESILESPSCYSASNRSQFTNCTCLHKFRNDEPLLDTLFSVLACFAFYDTQERKLFLTGIISHASLKQNDLDRGRKKLQYTL